jgi:hypothetical protein
MTSYIESSGILSLILGVLAWLTSVPVVLPVIGLALGINAIFKERKLSKRRPIQLYLGIAGCVINRLATLIILIVRRS